MARRRKIVSLAERRLEPVPEVVERLRDLLARARRGEVRGYAVATACDGRADASSYCIGDGSIAQLVLGIERAKLRLLAEGE